MSTLDQVISANLRLFNSLLSDGRAMAYRQPVAMLNQNTWALWHAYVPPWASAELEALIWAYYGPRLRMQGWVQSAGAAQP